MRNVFFAAILISSGSTALAQEPGDWVLSTWRGSTHYFPGVVQSRHGNLVNVRFDDGTVDAVRVDQLRPYNWRVGSEIECQWTDGNWYDAVITAMNDNGTGITVRYEDGVVQDTATGRCRTT